MALIESSVVFLSSGNYSRGRFAEYCSIPVAATEALSQWADFRGAALERSACAGQARGRVNVSYTRRPSPR
jgi:hypothetical protein